MTPAWPLFDLRITTPRLLLRMPREEELLELAERAAERVLSAEQATFMGPWTQIRSPEFEPSFMQYHWTQRGSWSPDHWSLQLCVYRNGADEPVGMIGAEAEAFALTRSAVTGSWLLPDWRGRGLGREARAAILYLLFEGLGAEEARSSAHPDNGPSNGVSRSLGYRTDGTEMFLAGDGSAVRMIRLVLSREDWLARRRDDIRLSGLEGCRAMFGV